MRKNGKPDPSSTSIASDDVFLTTKEAADLTKMSMAWYERKRWERGGPPFVRSGRTVRYVRSELLGWWAKKRIQGS